MSRAVRLLVNQLIKDLHDRPEDFTCDEHHLRDTKTSHQYWIPSGVGYYRMEAPYKVDFGLWHGWRFGKALGNWKTSTMLKASVLAGER